MRDGIVAMIRGIVAMSHGIDAVINIRNVMNSDSDVMINCINVILSCFIAFIKVIDVTISGIIAIISGFLAIISGIDDMIRGIIAIIGGIGDIILGINSFPNREMTGQGGGNATNVQFLDRSEPTLSEPGPTSCRSHNRRRDDAGPAGETLRLRSGQAPRSGGRAQARNR